jgi:hypothetical protein
MEEDTCMSCMQKWMEWGTYTCMSYEEEDTCMSYEEEDTCMAYEEQDADGVGHLGPSLVHKNLRVCFCDHALGRMRERRGG